MFKKLKELEGQKKNEPDAKSYRLLTSTYNLR